MSKIITSNKVKTSLDDRQKEITSDPGKWQAKQRAKKAPLVSSNKTQPQEFKTKGRIVGSDLSKMVTTMDVEPKRTNIKAKETKKSSSGKGGKKSAKGSSSRK